MDHIRGLSLHRWNKETIDRIGSMCWGTIEVDRQTKDFSTLSEGKIKVKTTSLADIPQVIYVKIEEQWPPIQLIPQLRVQEHPH